MLPDWVSNPGPLTYESGALPIALHGPTQWMLNELFLRVLYQYTLLIVTNEICLATLVTLCDKHS